MDNRHLFSRRKYSNKINPKERVEAHGFGLTSGRSPRRASASIIIFISSLDASCHESCHVIIRDGR